MQADLTQHIDEAMVISINSAIRSWLRPGTKNMHIKSSFDFTKVKVEAIAHYNILKVFHSLGKLPVVGKYFQARLWIEASV